MVDAADTSTSETSSAERRVAELEAQLAALTLERDTLRTPTATFSWSWR